MKTRHQTRDWPRSRQTEETGDGRGARGEAARKPREIPKRGWKEILLRTKNEIREDNLSVVAAGVAFYIFFGLIPALGAVVAIFGLVADPGVIQQQIDAMRGMAPPEALQIIDQQMTRIVQQSAGASWGAAVGILVALWSGSKATKALMTALNIAYEEEETRGFIRLNLTALGLTLAGVAGVILAVGIIVVVPIVMARVGIGSGAQTVVNVLRWPLLALFAVGGLAAVYRYAPDRDPAKWRWVSGGAVIATVLWLAISLGFSYYASHFGSYNKTYGSLGAVIMLLMWFLITAYAILIGAEFDSAMEYQTGEDTIVGPEKPRGQRGAYVADHVARAES